MTEEEFDTVIVGSGFGGSVIAYRLASVGSVCVLERGRAYPPGSFPRSPYRMQRAFWDPSAGLFGQFSVWSFRHFGAIVSSGLGGGSLIYANVMLRKDERWFVQEGGVDGEYWPISYADLEPHYGAVEQMIGVTPFPFRQDAQHTPSRTTAFAAAADRLDWKWFNPPLAVSFAPPGSNLGDPIAGQPGNLHGSTRATCRLTGECDIGCNYGSKNSLDYNYLSRAVDAGAIVRPLHEVRRFERLADGRYRVHYVTHDPDAGPRRTHDRGVVPTRTMLARRLVLSAGTLGSTYLLLRNRAALPGLSKQLGRRFSGNGDLLTLAVRPTRMLEGKRVANPIEAGTAPSITVAVRFPDTLDGGTGRGFYIEDAGYPDMLNWLIQAGELPGALWRWRHIGARLLRMLLRGRPDTNLSAELAALLGDGGLTAGILPLLGMGRDTPGGQMHLAGRLLDIDWQIDHSRPYFRRVRRNMQAFAEALGATFADNPIWHLGNQVVTVHPLGGVPMGIDANTGVVDGWGRVFGYDGLYVADGSIMPGSVGPNPSLTIAAVADRIASGIIDRGE